MSSVLSTEVEPGARAFAPRTDQISSSPGWAEVLGTTWRVELLVLLAFVLVGGTLRPLWDPDLPMHLATGEWIARHHALPTREPFAWTAVGAPFYTHSWAPQLLFYATFAAFGPIGLRVLDGVWLSTAAVAAFALGRAARWVPGATLGVSAANVIAAGIVTSGLRPQLVLFTLLPLAWALAFHLVRTERPRRTYAAFAVVSAGAVNSHFFFPLLLAPVVALWAAGLLLRKRAVAAAAAVAVCWLFTPYLFEWPRAVRTLATPSVIFRYPSSISELVPGFVSLATPPVSASWLIVLPLLALPWVLPDVPRRIRLVAGGYWTVGLVGFAMAVRLLAVWWLTSLPFVAMLFAARATRGGVATVRPAFKWVTYGLGTLVLLTQLWTSVDGWAAEGTLATRRLPTQPAAAVQPLADWLLARTRPGAGGRIFTGFDYGGYLTWRLPGYSASVDSRGGFADSILLPEMFVYAPTWRGQLGPWRAADLAVVPTRWQVAVALDTAAGWHRVAIATSRTAPSDTMGLWVREAWWHGAGRGPLPASPVHLMDAPPR